MSFATFIERLWDFRSYWIVFIQSTCYEDVPVSSSPGGKLLSRLKHCYIQSVMLQVNSECYTGWLDYWKGGHAHGSTDTLLSTLSAMRNYSASVNMYDVKLLYL